jgi:NAD(P)-dependent dehydrogenase (short-subunit alcohol dehydrogenase family)
MYNLQNRVAIITGAGRKGGIGAAVALKLAECGAHVIVADICTAVSDLPNTGNAAWEELVGVAEACAALGVRALPLRLDVTDGTAVESMISQVQAEFGRLDILVNNAGTAVGPAPVIWQAEEAWRRTLEINATGTFLCCQKAIPLLTQSEHGRVINMASIAAIRPKPKVAAYAASKAAVVAFTKSLAQEIAADGITVNAILPGDVDTEMKQWGMQMEALLRGQEKEEVVATTAAKIPLGRLALPADVANLAAFLASDEASFITGQAINVTGGREIS